MSRLFSAYVMVDWSAAAAARTGKDSIWIGVIKRDIRFRPTFEAHNPPTRDAAMATLREVLADLRRRGERVLIGFDFPLGYPEGTAALLKVKPADWSGMWAFLAKDVVDKPTNVNNRFAVAAKMNRLMTDEAWPFWGAPANDAQRWLATTKPTVDRAGLPPEFRRTEKLTQGKGKSGAKSVWQVFGNGTVGSQAIVGIPRVKALADEMGDKARAWPFQTGWKTLTEADLAGVEAVFAEVYPALGDVRPEPGEIADRAQVRALCEHFLRLDEAGKLGLEFGPKGETTDAERGVVETEEGWILGV
ncbi:cobalamin biosynthesis protein CbiG [Caulobacter mirabilis]|uniref:Cobalamin biosynthesis protein CbiG n=1 Tax=Caulobacter mirabilis TaxID=69666 RepID=A0A2D2AWQ5_9CAUL|nr:cobalamin biosynthesis protein CbiG [Caulobacter mirabilis]ATQ42442.1 cobalamin biosynthesis protein CbiG [Caulobacter mirabilis]